VNRGSGAFGFADADLRRIRGATFVRTVEHHREILSTNTRALSWAEDSRLELPALVLTDLQTAGRGRGTNRWWSAPGALTFSLIIPRVNSMDEAFGPRISLTAGLAVYDSLQQLRPGLEIGLKWPNDVYVRSRKICGILVEVSPRSPNRLVVGMGINVNNSLTRAPPPVAATAISLMDVAGYSFDLTVVLVRVLHQLADQLAALARADVTLANRWQELCMLSGRSIQVAAGQRTTVGTCQGIDESGALLVDTAMGRERCLSGIITVFG
jgi:BirA family biotin operon repressor/biotin-[acetyl-CoA-carboxylase] ligase